MALLSITLFVVALISAFAAIGFSVERAMPRIDAVIASRGQPVMRTIRIGAPYSGFKLI
jgi:hypothetical protein